MKLKRLVIQGFKSFKDRTTVNFDKGITGIVGPNGCGKSNIVDALFWVMGEQSAKHLRGSTMRDIIFAGSSKYQPASFAEVSLILENTHSRPIHIGHKLLSPSEIALTRKLYRNGETEYRINGVHCRMKDIQEVFMDTGAGPKAYSIIAQGEIDRLIQVRPEERKTMIEEVAGVTKFKLRRRDSLKKIEQTRSNLERIEDLRREIEKNLKSLKNQSERAARAKILKDKIEKSELLIGSHGVYSTLKRYQEEIQSIREKTLDLENWKLHRNSLEVGLEGERHLRDEKKNRLEVRMGQCHEISQKLATGQERILGQEKSLLEKEEQIQTRMKEADEFKKELEDRRIRLKNLKEEKNLLKNEGGSEEDFQILEKKVGEMKRQLKQDEGQAEHFNKKLKSLKMKRDKLEQNIFENRSRLKETEKILEESQREMTFLKKNNIRLTEGLSLLEKNVESSRQSENNFSHQEKSAKKALQKMEMELEKFRIEQTTVLKKLAAAEAELAPSRGLGNKEFLAVKGSEGFQLLQNLIKPETPWNRAVQVLLGELALTIVHKKGCFSSLKNRMTSRIEQNLIFLRPITPDVPEQELRLDGVGKVHPLKKLVTIPETWQKTLAPLLNGFFIAEYVDFDLFDSLPTPLPFEALASRDGAVVIKNIHGSKAIFINGSDLTTNMINLRKESEQLENHIEKLKKQILDKKEYYENIRTDLETARTIFAAKSSLLETKQDNMSTIAHRSKTLAEKRRESSELKIELNQKQVFFNRALNEIDLQMDRQQTELSKLEERQGVLKTTYDQEKEKFLTEQMKVKSLEERLNLLDSQIDDIGEQVKRQQNRLNNTRKLIACREQEVIQLQKDIKELKESNKVIEKNLQKEEMESSLLKKNLEQLLLNMEERESMVKKLGKNIIANEKEIIALQARKERHIHDEAQTTRNIFEKYRIDLRHAVGTYLGYDQDNFQSLQNIQNMYLIETEEGTEEIKPVPWTFTPLKKDDIKKQETEFKSCKEELSSLGEINWQALKDHDKQKVRYDFLKEQEKQLLIGLDDLEKAIGHIDGKSRERFVRAFEEVNDRFQKVFPIVFGGGNARLVLKGDVEDEQCGVEIIAQPPGKKMQNINLMSGGEKAMTAVILIFSIFLVRPSPFCLLDEVDAPLDDANVGRFNDVLKEMSASSQFILVTHNKKTMELNNTLYGVTMQEPGVSKAVSVQLH